MVSELRQAYNMIRSGKFKLSYIGDYLVGTLRYKVLEPGIDFSQYDMGIITFDERKAPLSFLIRKDVREAFKLRLKLTRFTCKKNLACIHCGCSVPALQLSNRHCDDCYPDMKTCIKQLKSKL